MFSLKRTIIMLIILLCGGILSQAKVAFSTLKITDTATGNMIEIDGKADDMLAQFFLFDRCAPQLSDIPDLKNGYEIQRGSVLIGKFEPFDMLVYYPGEDGRRGYIHYVGLVNSRGIKDGSSEYDNHWYAANLQTEPYLRELLFDEPVIETPFWQILITAFANQC